MVCTTVYLMPLHIGFAHMWKKERNLECPLCTSGFVKWRSVNCDLEMRTKRKAGQVAHLRAPGIQRHQSWTPEVWDRQLRGASNLQNAWFQHDQVSPREESSVAVRACLHLGDLFLRPGLRPPDVFRLCNTFQTTLYMISMFLMYTYIYIFSTNFVGQFSGWQTNQVCGRESVGKLHR